MPKLPIISGMEAIKVFSGYGWYPHRQVGSHVVLRKEGSRDAKNAKLRRILALKEFDAATGNFIADRNSE